MTEKSSLDLFRQALSEGVGNQFDKAVEGCPEEIKFSRKHNIAMRTIIYGKAGGARAWSPRMRRAVAILVAAALLLTSCGIIFREEIREVFDELFVILYFKDDSEAPRTIEEIYTLGYVPEGYVLEKEEITNLLIKYEYTNNRGENICFDQRPIDGSEFVIDSESGYSKIENIGEITVYYRFTGNYHYYIWNDEKYSMKLTSSIHLSSDEIVKIIKEITTK